MRDVVIVSSVRSPVGKANRGALTHTHPVDMGSAVLKGALDHVKGLTVNEVEDVMMGCAFPESEQGMNVAQLIAQRAGRHDGICGVTLNRMCSSGLQTIAMAHQAIAFGQADVIAAGGVESMSLVAMGGNHFMPNAALLDTFPDAYMNMGNTAENIAQKYEIPRQAQDEFALASHAKAVAAIDAGRFADETVALKVTQRDFDGKKAIQRTNTLAIDEMPRRDGTIEAMAKLRPVFNVKGSVTAGNASPLSDGAAMSILCTDEAATEYGLTPIARMLGFSVAGVPASLMGMGPVAAIPKALKQAGITLDDIGLIELNEAFAVQSLAVIQEAGLNPDIINVNGGAIALGHPLGCTGAKLTATLLHEMKRRNIRYGMVTMCVGGGMGAAGIFENLTV